MTFADNDPPLTSSFVINFHDKYSASAQVSDLPADAILDSPLSLKNYVANSAWWCYFYQRQLFVDFWFLKLILLKRWCTSFDFKTIGNIFWEINFVGSVQRHIRSTLTCAVYSDTENYCLLVGFFYHNTCHFMEGSTNKCWQLHYKPFPGQAVEIRLCWRLRWWKCSCVWQAPATIRLVSWVWFCKGHIWVTSWCTPPTPEWKGRIVDWSSECWLDYSLVLVHHQSVGA